MTRRRNTRGRPQTDPYRVAPSPDEIRRRSLEVQAGWSDAERDKRRRGVTSEPSVDSDLAERRYFRKMNRDRTDEAERKSFRTVGRPLPRQPGYILPTRGN